MKAAAARVTPAAVHDARGPAPPEDPRDRARLAALHRFGILDTPPEREFDDLVMLAARLAGAPMALLSLVDRDRVWFKARFGVEVPEVHRSVSPCALAIAQEGVFVVEDLAQDPRCASAGVLAGAVGIRFYAGAPLRTDDGHAIGTLCVLDHSPRTLDPAGRELLALLARQALALVERHYAVGCMSNALADNEELQVSMEREHERLGFALDAAELGWWEWVVPVDAITVGGHFERLFGLAPGEFDGSMEGLLDLVHPEDRAGVRARADEVLAGHVTPEVEFRTRRPAGEERWLAASGRLMRTSGGQPLKVNGTVRDVTVARRTREALRASQSLLRGFLDHAPVTMSLRSLDGSYLLVNREFERLFGITQAQAVGRRDVDVLPGQIDPRACRLQAESVAATGRPLSATNRICNARGATIDLLTTCFPLFGEDGEVRTIGTVGVDVGPLEQAKAELARLNAELEHRVAERTRELATATEELEAFSYAAAHDVRAPLRAILGYCALLMEKGGVDLPSEAASHARRIQANAQRMSELIDSLLEFGRTARGPLEKTRFDCATLVRETVTELALERGARSIELTIDAAVDGWGDRALVKQALANLIENAYKFTRRAPLPCIAITGARSGDETVLCVSDNGVGFDPACADRLFRAFQRLHSAGEFEGSGLGLAIAARIVRLHGGRLWAQGAPGEGARFYIALPAGARPHAHESGERTQPLDEGRTDQ